MGLTVSETYYAGDDELEMVPTRDWTVEEEKKAKLK
jgi:hypothetical protein